MADEQHSRNLVIGNVTILRDAYGRYNLSTLHRAGGHEDRHKPSHWLINKSTEELISELKSQGMNSCLETIHGGAKRGTYVSEDLAISYAGWISPKFQLIVNRAFIAMRDLRQQGFLPEPDPFENYPEMRAIRSVMIEVAKTRDEIAVVRGAVSDVRHDIDALRTAQKIQEAQSEEQAAQIAAMYSRTRPAGRAWPKQWMKDTGRGQLSAILYDDFLAHCRRIEKDRKEPDKYFCPLNYTWPLRCYSFKVLEDAYAETTKQLSLLRIPRRRQA